MFFFIMFFFGLQWNLEILNQQQLNHRRVSQLVEFSSQIVSCLSEKINPFSDLLRPSVRRKNFFFFRFIGNFSSLLLFLSGRVLTCTKKIHLLKILDNNNKHLIDFLSMYFFFHHHRYWCCVLRELLRDTTCSIKTMNNSPESTWIWSFSPNTHAHTNTELIMTHIRSEFIKIVNAFD